MNETTELVQVIIEGIQEKKGRDIVVADLRNIATAPCEFFVVCTCGSPQQVEAVAESVGDFARKRLREKPSAVAGLENALWVAMDYGTVMAHVFVADAREHYDLEHLWNDAELKAVPDID